MEYVASEVTLLEALRNRDRFGTRRVAQERLRAAGFLQLSLD